MSACVNHVIHILLSIILIQDVCRVRCHEKNLRKIVREKEKMVQRSFSHAGIGQVDLTWRNFSSSLKPSRDQLESSVSAYKPIFHSANRPIRSKQLFSAMDIQPSILGASEKAPFMREIPWTSPDPLVKKQQNSLLVPLPDRPRIKDRVNNELEELNIEQSRPEAHVASIGGMTPSLYFVDEHLELSGDSKSKEDHRPEPPPVKNNETPVVLKATFPKPTAVVVPELSRKMAAISTLEITPEDEKFDFLIEESPGSTDYSFTTNENTYACPPLSEVPADINLQEKFAELDVEPKWCKKKTFWDNIYESRYESLMRNPKWPPLQVIMVLRSQVASFWRSTFSEYHASTVSQILDNTLKKMLFYPNMTFTWNEVSHLSRWFKSTSHRNKLAFRRLVKTKRLEITNGFFVEPEEATTSLFGLIHQLIEGHHWLKQQLNVTPQVAWLTSSVSHSPTVPYILAASDVHYLVLTNLHFAWEDFLADYQYSDFVWVQNWDQDRTTPTELNEVLGVLGKDRNPKNSVLTHYLQFNSAGIKACGPQQYLCLSEFNFGNNNPLSDIGTYNVKQKAELLLEQYSKTGSITPHNVIIAPIGGPFQYENQIEFDYQYNNYQRLADYINQNADIYNANIRFGTAYEYFQVITQKHNITFPKVKGDFLNYADIENGTPAYWAGYYTTRPMLKILLRRLQWALRSAEILFSFACTSNVFEETNVRKVMDVLNRVRVNIARLMDRNVGGGTLSVAALRHVHTLILDSAKDCWIIQEVAASLLTGKPKDKQPYLQKYVYRDGEFISVFRSVVPGDQMYVFNSLSHERTEIVELIARQPNIRILDHNKKDVKIQVNPIWRYQGGSIKISSKYFKIVFAAVIPPLTFELYKISQTYDGTANAALIFCRTCVSDSAQGDHTMFPFAVQPMQAGDVQLESYKYRVIVDELTGFVKTIAEKETNKQKTLIINYGAFRSSDVNSGMYLFNTNTSKPLDDMILQNLGKTPKVVLIMSGQVTTELYTIYGTLLQHSVKLLNLLNGPMSNAIYVESKVDFEASPKYREYEFFLSIQTDISNGNPPEIITDNNGFQYTARKLNISRRVESNMYPMTTMAFVQDSRSRFTVLTDHAAGVTALQEGQLLLMLDRRVLYSDGRGVSEGLADSSATCHRHYLLLENFNKHANRNFYSVQGDRSKLILPSLNALHLSSSFNYLLDIFLVDRNRTNFTYFSFHPLIKLSFPCDASLLNFRVVFKKETKSSLVINTALMVLHRQSFSCDITNNISCTADSTLSLHKILRNIKTIFKTNLSGTSKGTLVKELNYASFPPMELAMLRLHF